MKLFKTILFTSMLLLIVSCGEERKKYLKSPLDTIITTHIDTQNYSVILADMDYKEDTDKYYHKYKIIIEKAKNTTEAVEDDFDIKTTEWQEVSAITFEDYQEDLGMTILSKKEGVLDKQSTPAGYSNYVGNEKYGHWQTHSNGSSFWAFYGQYHFMSSLFYGPSHRYYRNDYDYYRTNHYRRSSYYGRNKNFGTSTYKNANSNWNSKPKTFKDKVRTNVTRSSSALKSKGYSSSKSYNGSSQTSRNTNRYSNSSSSRSRSGGFGK
ncbi:hypothetical protein [Cellulophaga sp. L1A9]|uniref:hypothetical protein n=1 Tax=Cellulophaga sp. L1A9 TaxID=2686362 RepID=UPI00131AEFB5|nr:hypothetical protein [Cellulophaga sp. L1A9]